MMMTDRGESPTIETDHEAHRTGGGTHGRAGQHVAQREEDRPSEAEAAEEPFVQDEQPCVGPVPGRAGTQASRAARTRSTCSKQYVINIGGSGIHAAKTRVAE